MRKERAKHRASMEKNTGADLEMTVVPNTSTTASEPSRNQSRTSQNPMNRSEVDSDDEQ